MLRNDEENKWNEFETLRIRKQVVFIKQIENLLEDNVLALNFNV